MKHNIILSTAFAVMTIISSCGETPKADDLLKAADSAMKADKPADSYTLKNVTLSGNATEIKNAGLEITLPQGWNVPEPAVFRDENGIISAIINRGENSFAEISIEKTRKENLYATFADFHNDHIDS